VEVIVEAVLTAIIDAHAAGSSWDHAWADAACRACLGMIEIAAGYGRPAGPPSFDPARIHLVEFLSAAIE